MAYQHVALPPVNSASVGNRLLGSAPGRLSRLVLDPTKLDNRVALCGFMVRRAREADPPLAIPSTVSDRDADHLAIHFVDSKDVRAGVRLEHPVRAVIPDLRRCRGIERESARP